MLQLIKNICFYNNKHSGQIGAGVLMIITGYVDCNPSLAVFMLCLVLGVNTMSFSGYLVNSVDLSPKLVLNRYNIGSFKTTSLKMSLVFANDCIYNYPAKWCCATVDKQNLLRS